MREERARTSQVTRVTWGVWGGEQEVGDDILVYKLRRAHR